MSVKKNFLKDFRVLLDKYYADIDYEDISRGGYHDDTKCIVTIAGCYDDEGNTVQEFCRFDIMDYYREIV